MGVEEEVTVTGGTGVLELNGVFELPGGGSVELPQSLRIALATGQVRRPLAETLRDVLVLLVDGRYQLAGPERLPAEHHLVPTSEWPPCDEARVAYYRTAIRTGHRPVAVVLSGVQPLILDGHHKIAAYEAEGVCASAVVISEAPA
ncbi:hypothetical protein [Amycolatopsis sp. FDAARGOS 1241]|uniref:hypothetical protein n=1 Tax=Amycolatopsis sp. FDAARGOS 1241 TaxID=2778070 RepID=UPI00194DD6DC|nr:hypothetical protein [Amycolatopsis sp. FDAARGOS 1241]QRP46372.1 hypothetical protein I6J71_46455 [Amycolatopsis sp. FDAARGOS 1241]